MNAAGTAGPIFVAPVRICRSREACMNSTWAAAGPSVAAFVALSPGEDDNTAVGAVVASAREES